jgi:hypothetical protein
MWRFLPDNGPTAWNVKLFVLDIHRYSIVGGLSMSNKRLMVSLGLGFVTLTMAVWGQRTQPSLSPNPPSPSHFLGHPRLFHPRKLSQIIRDSLPTPLSSPTQAECNRVISQAVYNLSQPWTADNRPFRQARLQIEKLYAKMDVPTFMQKVVLPYHRAALKHPTDALIVFRYGYALQLGVKVFPTIPYDE